MSSLSNFMILFLCIAYAECTDHHHHNPHHISSAGSDAMPRYIFLLADRNHDSKITISELHQIFLDFDRDHNDEVSAAEFLEDWRDRTIGSDVQAVILFNNLDLNKDGHIREADLPWIQHIFDTNGDLLVSEAEFVIQWLKIMSTKK